MGFIKSTRKLQRFRKMFECKIVGPPGAVEALADAVKTCRKISKQIVDDAGGSIPESRLVRQRKAIYDELRDTFASNGLPIASSASQLFSRLGRGEDIEHMPLVFGNRARSLKSQEEVEIFVRGKSIALKGGTSHKSRTFSIDVDEVPGDEYFVQIAEVFPSGKVHLIVTLTREEAESRKGQPKRKRKRTKKASTVSAGKPLVSIGDEVYSLDEEAIGKIESKVNDKTFDKVCNWIRKHGEPVGFLRIRL